MQNILRFLSLVVVAGLVTLMFGQQAPAQTARTFGKKAITVRLCPAKCQAVNGHGYKPGGATKVYETRSGWARVSGYLDRAKLVASFGDKITKKPALWVPVSSLAPVAKAKKPAAKKKTATKKPGAKKSTARVAPRRVNVVRQLARLRNVPLPDFRPGTSVATTVAEPAPVAEAKPAIVEANPTGVPAVEANPETAEPKVEVAETKSEAVETKPEAVERTPAATSSPSTGGTAGLTWEQVQAKIKAQQAGEKVPAPPAAPKTEETPKVEGSDQSAKLEEARMAREKAEATRLAEETRKKAEEVEAARVAEEAKKKEADRLAAEAVASKEEKERLAKEEAKRLADEAEVKQQAEVAKVAEEAAAAKEVEVAAAKAAEEETRKAAEAAAAKEAEEAAGKTAETAAAATPTPTERPKAEEVKLPPLAPKETAETTPVAEGPKTEVAAVLPATKPETPEPVFKSANADPIAFGARPKKLTKALLDKRLRKLPGRKSKVRPDVVIALRHYALGLLKSGECTGIERGGPSAAAGMLFVACTEDPTYLRQFPLQEESW